MHRYRLDLGEEPTKLLVMESRGHVRWPKRYRNEFGQLIEGRALQRAGHPAPDAACVPMMSGATSRSWSSSTTV